MAPQGEPLAHDLMRSARQWERIGNAYRLSLSAEGAPIEDLVEPTSAPPRAPLEELAKLPGEGIFTLHRNNAYPMVL